ncbi:hypothetical protein NQ317_017740 [Molorchus minor]|uniref:Reverse transcriptase n=1 Tax=Molorchus minor TaxID=1323400 RepID=A0ABQ9J1N2_9CUCU|nr:hypothetical protein NQ317_017740 [Molorchus minor]
MVTGLLTGHCHLSRHLQLIGIVEDPECRWCLEDEETSSHVLTECPAIARVRERHFGSSVLNPEDVKRIQPRKLCTFAKEDTTVLISLYSVHYDKEYWIDPENFRPERFLDDEGKLLPHERLIPFGNVYECVDT